MFTIELQPTSSGTFHCFFCGRWFSGFEAAQVIVLEDGNITDMVCQTCLQLDADGRADLVSQQVAHLRQRADALEALLGTGLPAVPSCVEWRLFGEATLRARHCRGGRDEKAALSQSPAEGQLRLF